MRFPAERGFGVGIFRDFVLGFTMLLRKEKWIVDNFACNFANASGFDSSIDNGQNGPIATKLGILVNYRWTNVSFKFRSLYDFL